MVPIGDGVAKLELLAAVPGAVVAREVCDFLATLLLPMQDPLLIDGLLLCVMSLSVRCLSIVFRVFVRVGLWSLVLAPVSAGALFVWTCPMGVGFHLVFF
jgi:hypothetical protein